MGLIQRSVQISEDLHAAVDAQRAAVERDIVVLGVPPLHIRVKPVVGCAPLILIPQALLRGLLALAIHLDDALCAKRGIGVDEHAQKIRLIAQDVVCTPPHDDAGAFLGQIRDDLELDFPKVVLVVWPQMREGRGQKPARRGFIRLLYIAHVKPAFAGDLLQ